jgi:hypothetical protein
MFSFFVPFLNCIDFRDVPMRASARAKSGQAIKSSIEAAANVNTPNGVVKSLNSVQIFAI